MSDLEGWSRIIEGYDDQEAKETQSKAELKGNKSPTDQIAEQFND